MCYGIGWGKLIYLLGVVVPAVEVCSCAQMFAMGLPTTVVHAHAEKGESEAPDAKKNNCLLFTGDSPFRFWLGFLLPPNFGKK